MLKSLTSGESKFSERLLDYIEMALRFGPSQTEDAHEGIKVIQRTMEELSSLPSTKSPETNLMSLFSLDRSEQSVSGIT
jgi:hypothetical protein